MQRKPGPGSGLDEGDDERSLYRIERQASGWAVEKLAWEELRGAPPRSGIIEHRTCSRGTPLPEVPRLSAEWPLEDETEIEIRRPLRAIRKNGRA